MPENPQNHPPKIPLGEAAAAFEKFGCGLFLAIFVFRPRVATISACIDMFVVVCVLPALIGKQARKYEYGLDAELLECS